MSLCSALHLLAKLKRIDLSGNSISSIDDKALRLLPALRDLILPENKLVALPTLPTSIEVLDVRMNRLQSSGIQPEAFRVSQGLAPLSAACHLGPQPHTHTHTHTHTWPSWNVSVPTLLWGMKVKCHFLFFLSFAFICIYFLWPLFPGHQFLFPLFLLKGYLFLLCRCPLLV